MAVRDEDGVKRKLVIFESLVELPLEVGDTFLCVGLMASEYGGRIMWNAYANTCMILKVGDDLESLRLQKKKANKMEFCLSKFHDMSTSVFVLIQSTK